MNDDNKEPLHKIGVLKPLCKVYKEASTFGKGVGGFFPLLSNFIIRMKKKTKISYFHFVFIFIIILFQFS